MNTQKATPETPAGVAVASNLNIGHRIKVARGTLSQSLLAARLGVHTNTIGKLERGAAMPDATLLIAIGNALGVSPAWLLLGDAFEKDASHQGSQSPSSLDAADLVLIPSYGVEASAGNGSPVEDEHVIGRFAFKKSWLARKGLNPNHLAVVTARGDSMEPTVRDGDILLVDRNVSKINADGVYLIERDNELYCKRLQRRFDGGVTIMSDNARYEPQQLAGESADSLNVTGRVIWIGGER